MKHKHADLIKQWADGAVIQQFFMGRWMVEQNPDWNLKIKYRIKPDTDEVSYLVKISGKTIFEDDWEEVIEYPKKIKVFEKIKIVRESKTGKLKSAEVL